MEPTKKMLLTMAHHIFKDFEREWAQYDADCELSAREGYSISRCFHGTNLWTSYDPMCGPCEDGYSWFNRPLYRQLSLDMARRDLAEWVKRCELLQQLYANDVPGLDWGQLFEWAGQPVNKHRNDECNAMVSLSLDKQF